MSFDPAEDAAAKGQHKAGQRAVKEHIGDGLAKVLEGGDSTSKGASAPRLEEADRSANAKTKTDWQWS